MKEVTILLVYNHNERNLSLGTVWLGAEGFFFEHLEDENDEDTTPLEEILLASEGWFKVVGPIDYEEAGAVKDRLGEFFARSGVKVMREGVVD